MLTSYPADRLHDEHPPPPASEQSRQPAVHDQGGSILDADPPAQGVKFARRNTGNAALHDLHDLLMIALCTVLSGGENATDMAEFAKAKEPLLRGFLPLRN